MEEHRQPPRTPRTKGSASRPPKPESSIDRSSTGIHATLFFESSKFRQRVLQYPAARRALSNLCECGVDRDEFLSALEVSVGILNPESTRRPYWEIKGMPPRRLLKLAEQME